jgi:hypothetical protein
MRSRIANQQSATGRNSMRRTAVILCLAALPLGFVTAASAGAAGSQTAHINGNGRLEASFTARPVSVTPNLGMVELIVSGTGTVQGFGTATEVVGVVEDQAASPCGAGGASDSAERRIVMQAGLLELHEAAMLCMTASGPRVTGTYRVDGQASTGIFAGARGVGNVAVDPATGHDTVSGTLILRSPEA